MDGHRSICTLILASLLALMISSGCGMSSGSGGPGPGIETNEFVIENIQISKVTDTTAVVTWNTSFTSLSSLTVSDVPSLERPLRITSPVGTSHEARLTDLVPSTDYYYQVSAARTATGDTTSSRGTPFTTAQDADLYDVTPPVISNIEVINITSQSATILWTTDDRCNGKTNYGTISIGDFTINEQIEPPQTHLRNHSIQLLDLDHTTQYRFSIEATNVAGLEAVSNPMSFTTASIPSVKFCPDQIAGIPGDTFDITVCVNDVSDMGAIRLEIQVNPNYIEITGQPVNGAFWSENNGHVALKDYSPIDGTAIYEATWEIEMNGNLALGTLADGSGIICTIPCKLKSGAIASTVQFSEDIRIIDYLRNDVEIADPGSCSVTIAR